MSAHSLPINIDKALRNGFFRQDDPGSAGTLAFDNKGQVIFEIVTAGAENRALPAASGYAVGTRCMVIGKTLAGVATITGAEESALLTTDGDVAEFVVSLSGDTHVWRIISYSPSSNLDFSAAPVNVTGAYSVADTGITNLLTALETLGLITDSTTPA